jgi:hypothetical protein
MSLVTPSESQLQVAKDFIKGATFLEGPAGTGKTTAAIIRALHMIYTGVPADSILVIVPQRTLARPYFDALRQPDLLTGGQVTILTMGGLARRMLDLFWPLIAGEIGFTNPDLPPTFLTLETAQYYMAQLVKPLLDQGFFETVTIDRNRLYSQILDNLNKAAVIGFSHTEIGERLKNSWIGDSSQKRIFDEAQACANAFREKCLEENLLDFSLQIEAFAKVLWPLPLFGEYLKERFRYLIVDNVEEDTPVSHDLLLEWLPHTESMLIIYDTGGGYRRFLGADAEHAYSLKGVCHEHVSFGKTYVNSPDLRAFAVELSRSLGKTVEEVAGDARSVLQFKYHRYYPQMLDWVTETIADLVNNHSVSPNEIVVLAPFMTDVLRFSLMTRLDNHSIPSRTHRPSRALREEPIIRCVLTLASISHPQWGIKPAVFDVAQALMIAIRDLDLVRAHLLANVLYRIEENVPTLQPFEQVNPEMQERMTYILGERYERLRTWIDDQKLNPETEFDLFLGRLFGEVLSQIGYGFHSNYDAGVMVANLIESIQKFRWTLGSELARHGISPGREYVRLVQDGLVASSYVRSWNLQPMDAVLLAPAYTFLMYNRPVDIQFWLDVGGIGWWERLYQPLTHPYVLSRWWPKDAKWTDADEFKTRQEALHALTQGLIRRCRRGIFLGLSELGEGGYEQRGPLLQAIHRVLLDLPAPQFVRSSDV